jgi:hypothetical protein
MTCTTLSCVFDAFAGVYDGGHGAQEKQANNGRLCVAYDLTCDVSNVRK